MVRPGPVALAVVLGIGGSEMDDERKKLRRTFRPYATVVGAMSAGYIFGRIFFLPRQL